MTHFDKPTIVFAQCFRCKPKWLSKELTAWRRKHSGKVQEYYCSVSVDRDDRDTLYVNLILYYSLLNKPAPVSVSRIIRKFERTFPDARL